MITIQNADKALKDYYLEAVASQLNDNISPFYAAIEKSSANVYGKNAKIAVVRSNAGSVLAGPKYDNSISFGKPYGDKIY